MYLASDSGELIGQKSSHGCFNSLFRFYKFVYNASKTFRSKKIKKLLNNLKLFQKVLVNNLVRFSD